MSKVYLVPPLSLDDAMALMHGHEVLVLKTAAGFQLGDLHTEWRWNLVNVLNGYPGHFDKMQYLDSRDIMRRAGQEDRDVR